MAPGPIVLFGAAGKTGRAVTAALRRRGVAEGLIRPLVRAGTQGPGEWGVDLTDPATLAEPFAGAEVLHVLAPNLHPDEPVIVRAAVTTARSVGVPRIVYHSVLRPGIRAMPHHWHKLVAEEMLWSTGLEVTVLQPSAYAQNLVACVQRSELVVPYRVDVPFSLVDLADVADVTARVLTEPAEHAGATYELAGPVWTIAEVAAALGLTARRSPVSDPDRAPGDDPDHYGRQALRAMFDWYDRHGLAGCPRVLEHLLGRRVRPPDAVLVEALP